jgi:hypothetical protein
MQTREWRFFDNGRGQWNWEVLDSFGGIVDDTPSPFATFELCLQDATRHGLQPDDIVYLPGGQPLTRGGPTQAAAA